MKLVLDGYDSMISRGFAACKDLCPIALTKPLLEVTKSKLSESLEKLGDQEIGIGSAAGYKEICQRSKGRWDVPLDLDDFGIDYKKSPWWPLVTKVLGEDAEPCFQGIISSAPHTPAQEWHIDSPHLTEEHQSAHVINVLVALEDIDLSMGPTEMAVGSHIYTNHLENPAIVIDKLVYQCSETTPATLLSDKRKNEFETWTTEMTAGTCLLFDDRVLHRGQENSSNKYRHVAYFSYCKKGYDQNTYFESDKSLN